MFRSARRQQAPAGLAPVWAACGALLDYPTAELVASLDAVERLVPGDRDLVPVIDFLRRTELRAAQERYVETFDHTRKCALYLTYFAHGDTRRRGVALVQFKQAYRKAGAEWVEESEELPDHLGAVLQFGATVDADTTWRLLNQYRAGVEMLRLALTGWDRGAGSPWLGVVAAVCRTLPPLRGDEAEAVQRLIAEGPPAEEVGVEFLGMPR